MAARPGNRRTYNGLLEGSRRLPAARESGLAIKRQLSSEHLRTLLEKAEGFGVSSTRLLRHCELSFNLRDLQQGIVTTVSQAVFAQICETCVHEIRRLALPSGAPSMSRNDFDLMCHALISSSSLREVIERTAQFLEMCDRRYGWHRLSERRHELEIEILLGPAEVCWETFFIINAFQVFARFHEWVIGGSIETRFEMACEASREAVAIARMFGLDVRFGGTSNRIVLPSSCLDAPVVRDAQELRLLLQCYPFDASPPRTDTLLSSRVSSIIQDAVNQRVPLPTLAQIARRMGMANATLRRHLAVEGETLRSLKERVRSDAALKMLAADRVHTDEMAVVLGFSSSKAFSRAFVSWSGLTPRAYRRQLRGPHMERRDRAQNGAT